MHLDKKVRLCIVTLSPPKLMQKHTKGMVVFRGKPLTPNNKLPFVISTIDAKKLLDSLASIPIEAIAFDKK